MQSSSENFDKKQAVAFIQWSLQKQAVARSSYGSKKINRSTTRNLSKLLIPIGTGFLPYRGVSHNVNSDPVPRQIGINHYISR